MKIIHPAPDTFDGVIVELNFLEAIGLYKMALAINHPGDGWGHPAQLQYDEDAGPVSAALVVQLKGLVEG